MATNEVVQVDLDRPRALKFRIGDLRGLETALGNITLLDVLTRLAGLDVNALVQAVRFGLLHEEPRLNINRAEQFVQAHIDRYGDISRLADALGEALNATGLISLRTPAAGGNGTDPGEAPGRPAS